MVGDRVAFQDYRPLRFRLLLTASTLPPTMSVGYMYCILEECLRKSFDVLLGWQDLNGGVKFGWVTREKRFCPVPFLQVFPYLSPGFC